jgi:hypothetical protein
VKRRFRPLIYILAAAQLLLAVPMTSAASPATSHSFSMPCADSMPADDAGDCPCCPHGAQDMAACLSACTLAHAAISTIQFASAPARSIPARAPAFVPVLDVSDPPLKPPPII